MSAVKRPSKRTTAADIFVVAAVVLSAVASALVFSLRSDGATYTVSYDGGAEVFPLDADSSFTLSSNGHRITITSEDGAVFVSESDCPDKICVNSGTISKNGQAIVCVPARVVVKVGSSTENTVDAIAGGVS